MFPRQATVVAIVGVIFAACSAGAAPTASPQASPSPSHRPPSLAKVSPSPTTPIVTLAPAATPGPTATATPAPVPPKPTGVRFLEESDCLSDSCHRAKFTQTVMWRTPRTKGVEIRVYGVTKCLAEPDHPKPGASGPCLVKNTRLPASVRRLLSKAPASDGWVSWSWKQETGCEIGPFSSRPGGPSYFAIVVGAYSASGHSIFAIAQPGGWYMPEPDEMIC